MTNGNRVDDSRISGLISTLYEAAADPIMWTSALDDIGDALGGAALVSGFHRPGGMAFGVSNRLDPDADKVLRERYASPSTNPFFAAMPRLPILAPVAREALMADDTYFQSGLYNDVFREQGFVHAGLSCLARENGVIIPCGVLRRKDREFDVNCFRIYEAILPHLRRALELTVRFSDLVAARHHADAVANATGDGFIVTDASAKVVFSNALAERVLFLGDGLVCRKGILIASRSEDTAKLHALISSATLRTGYLGGDMRVSRPAAAVPWALVVMPAEGELAGIASARNRIALVRLIRMESSPAAPEVRLMCLFGLSKAEAAIATGLLAGARPEEIADRRNLRITTVRTHIRSIYLKTGTSRQAELIRLLFQVSGPSSRL